MTTLPKTLLQFIWHFIKKWKWQFAIMFFSTSAHVLESNVQPYALKLMIDTVTRIGTPVNGDAYRQMAVPLAVFLGASVLLVSLFRLQENIHIKVIPQFQATIRMSMFAYVQDHSHSYFADHFAGSIAAKIGDLPRAALNIFEFARWRIMTTFWVTLVAVISLGAISLYVSLVMTVWVLLTMFISYYSAKKVNKYAKNNAEDVTILQGHIVDVITNITAMRLFSHRAYEQKYIGGWQAIEQASNQKMRASMLKARLLIDAPTIIMLAAMLMLLIQGWQTHAINAGDMVFIMFSTINVMQLSWMLGTELPHLFSEIGVGTQALNLITRTHDVVDKKDATPLMVTHGEIMFENVHFHYIPGRDIFRDKTLHIRAGEKIGLVGFSGSGKTTFIHLLLRFFDVEHGRILIDEQDIAEVTQESLRAQIAMIPQDTTLFHRTLMENIRYGRLEASDEEVIEASKMAHCHEFIAQLNEGYGALVGERGIKLSGGQRQRIAIARALLKRAPILILDEATSSLDSVTEKTIKDSLSLLMKDRTTIIIAHRLSTLADMDRILVFEKGRIVEDGSHKQLLASCGHYAHLWNMQAGGFLPESDALT